MTPEAMLFTAGVDIARDRIEVEVVGWAAGSRTPTFLGRIPLMVPGERIEAIPCRPLGRRATRRARGRARAARRALA